MEVRTIQVSDATYAAIWARWKEGDDGEDGILRREFGVKGSRPEASERAGGRGRVGYRDNRYGVEFEEGFSVFRTYKGHDYRAIAEKDGWTLSDGRRANSLNILSSLIGAATENAWMGWYFQDGSKKRLIAELRDQEKITRRS
jgi:hypothetical protein